MGACVFSRNLPPALASVWPGYFTCYCGNTAVERIQKSESAQTVDPGEENSTAALVILQSPALYLRGSYPV